MWNFGRWFGYVYEGSYGIKKPPSEVGGERKEILQHFYTGRMVLLTAISRSNFSSSFS